MKRIAKRLLVGTPLEPFARRMLRVALRGNPLRRAARDQRRTEQIAARVLKSDSNCVDVGSSYGDFLAVFLELAPHGTHFAFEPVHDSAELLRQRYPAVQVFEMALGNSKGVSEFFHAVDDPGYSGLKRRSYPKADFQVHRTQVATDTLDNVLPEKLRIDLLKVDVEGGELQVFQGAQATIQRSRPVILFEHGRGAADCYGTTPDMVFDLLGGTYELRIWTLDAWLRRDAPLTRDGFVAAYRRNSCNYVAAP